MSRTLPILTFVGELTLSTCIFLAKLALLGPSVWSWYISRRTNICLSILPYMVALFYSIWNGVAGGSKQMTTHRSNGQYSKNKFQTFLPQKRTSRTLVIWLEFCCTSSFFKVNAYARIYGVNPTICKQRNMRDLHIGYKTFRPISNLSLISKAIERAAASRFTDHASLFQLLPVHQSAYRKFHSTEAAVLIVHNDIAAYLR